MTLDSLHYFEINVARYINNICQCKQKHYAAPCQGCRTNQVVGTVGQWLRREGQMTRNNHTAYTGLVFIVLYHLFCWRISDQR